MSDLEFKVIAKSREKCKQGGRQLYVSVEQHDRIKDISEKSRIPMYEVTEMLIDYALEHVKWVEK